MLRNDDTSYRRLLDAIPAIAWSASAKTFAFTYVSRAAEKLLGYPVQRWLEDPSFWANHLHPDDRHVAKICHDETLACRDHELVYRMIAADGRIVHLRDYINVHIVDGVPVELFGVMVDITHERELEAAARLSDLGQLAASLAHEFNNVLMAIQPFIEVIDRSAKNPHIENAVGHITRAISRGKRASEEVLSFSSPKDPQLSATEVVTWLPNVLAELEAILPGNVRLMSDVAPDVGWIRCDSAQLEQVVTNLVFNARHAVNDSGTITVAASKEGELVRLSVLDDGCGIPQAMLGRIFEPLVTTKRNGTGLGLPIVRRLVESQGGTVHVENREGGGAAFHLLIPMAYGSEPVAGTNSTTPKTSVKRILLVEDDESVGEAMSLLLIAEGFETVWVRTAENARDAVLQTCPEVAIIDINLPDGDGVDLAARLRGTNSKLPIIYSTGHAYAPPTDGRGILSLLKPYKFDDLLRAIQCAVAA